MLFWALLILIANGVVSFAYSVTTATDTATLWAMLATTFVYFLGITQTGIIFSAIMRISRSGWGRYFSRLGEILTLSFIPVAAATFIIIYLGGVDHIFYWANPGPEHGAHHISPWLNKKFFLCRIIITMSVFYIISLIYFRAARKEENEAHASVSMEKTLNVLAGLLFATYIAANTNIAWDFGMMIIPHWESSIFPPYYWAGNLLSGSAFLYLMSNFFIPREPGEKVNKRHLDSMGKVLLGFTLLWIYMHWSQHIVIWYSNLPNLITPVAKRMSGNFTLPFVIMLLTIFVVPFFALLFRGIKLSVEALFVVAVIICVGVWINRYLMIIPVFSDGSTPTFATWTGVSLIAGGLSSVILSLIIFFRLFPGISARVRMPESGH